MNNQILLNQIRAGNRRALGKAITLTESHNPAHRKMIKEIMRNLSWKPASTRRIAISGPPGVGKSTFIDQVGSEMLKKRHKIAILAIDPSSQETMGSILGDKTRMLNLSRHDDVFIRPSPAGKTLGGVTRRTRECITLCEIAGYDTIIIETVGVGQSETLAHSMVDLFVTLHLPGSGDDLQGMKKGIIERSDMIIINKSDQHPAKLIQKTTVDLKSALNLLNHGAKWQKPVLTCSSIKKNGISEIIDKIDDFFQEQIANGQYEINRQNQNLKWFDYELPMSIFDHLNLNNTFTEKKFRIRSEIDKGKISVLEGIEKLIAHITVIANEDFNAKN